MSQSGEASPFGTLPVVTNTDWATPNNVVSLDPLPSCMPSSTPSRNSGGTAGVLDAERSKASFKTITMTNYIDGGPKVTAKRRWILSPTKGTDMSGKYFQSRSELLESHLHHFFKVHDEFTTSYIPTREEVGWMQENAMNSGAMMNHWGLFIPTLLIQASDEQKGEWLSRAMMTQIVGCYAQTELGHGSNVRALQTTATYNPSTDSFIMDTPTLTATKWWPGALGKVATHALVYAQLIVEGRELGVHSFIVQIRDEHHRPLKGIQVGDLGPKLGDVANDTGFLRMDKVSIPRTNMLSRFQQVTKEGKYVKAPSPASGPGADKLHYATMMFARGAMVKQSGGMLARAVTIAVRYSAVRKQGFKSPSTAHSFKSEEVPILDHQIQLYRLAKQLAVAYALKFTGKAMTDMFSALEGGSVVGGIANADHLSEIAATSAGLKGICTLLASDGIEDCRKACGGNGYLLASGIAALGADYVWQTTAEGDFIILSLQSARFIMKHIHDARNSKTALQGALAYLNPIVGQGSSTGSGDSYQTSAVETFEDLLSLEVLQRFAELRALGEVAYADSRYTEALGRTRPGHSKLSVSSGASAAPLSDEDKAVLEDQDAAWAAVSLDMVSAVNHHCHAYIISTFKAGVDACEDGPCKRVLSRLCALFAITSLLDRPSGAPFASPPSEKPGMVLPTRFQPFARQARDALLQDLRADMVALVDAFDIPDRVLNSTIGRADGNVYEALFEAALKSNLNHVDPFIGYDKVLRSRVDVDCLNEGKVDMYARAKL